MRIGQDSIPYVYSLHVPVHLVAHPVAQDALLALRDATTRPSHFRRLAHRLSLVVTLDATRDLTTEASTVNGPLGPAPGDRVAADVVVVPVVRAGLGMLDSVLELLPQARVGYIGLQRDEHTAIASQYYSKLPPINAGTTVLLTDPMLATGGSAVAAANIIAAAGARDIRLLCVVAAPEGIAALEAAHPAIRIFTPVVDRGLNAQKFILPGLGDFGDRLYGT
jgi:uracil phosphoribosyltransferase